MQISRKLLMTCAVAAFLTPTLAHAYDNEAQIRARQALEDKMKQIDAQTPPTTSTPPTPAKPAPRPAVTKPRPPEPKLAPPVVTVTPNSATIETPAVPATPAFAPEISQPATPATVAPITVAPAMTVSTPDSATANKLSDALHQKMSETASEPVVMPAPPQKPAKPAKPAPPVVVKAPPVQQNMTVTKPTPPAVTVWTPTYAPIPEPSNTVRPALPETPTPVAEPMSAGQISAPPFISLPALTGPPSSLSAAKQQKLDALLQQYRMDQLTPQQYHEERAKVLSEP